MPPLTPPPSLSFPLSTASNYAGLEQLYRKFGPRGFTVLAFPCNQFAWQEPGDATSIKAWAAKTHAVTFPLFAKVEVKGAEAHPVFKFLLKVRCRAVVSHVHVCALTASKFEGSACPSLPLLAHPAL